MIINDSNISTGWPNQVITTLLRRISAYTRGGISFKIGITSGYYTRAGWYRRNTRYSEMILLYQTSSDDHARDLERDMIDYYWEYCDNSISGGGGSMSGPPYYLYIVR